MIALMAIKDKFDEAEERRENSEERMAQLRKREAIKRMQAGM